MEYTKEKVVQHNEWEEITIPAAEFLLNAEMFKDEEDDDFDHYPTLNFENDSVDVDEMWGVNKNGRLWSSSGNGGVMEWSEAGQVYIHHIHFRARELGQFVSATFRLSEEIGAVLKKIEARTGQEQGSTK